MSTYTLSLNESELTDIIKSVRVRINRIERRIKLTHVEHELLDRLYKLHDELLFESKS